MKNRTFSRRTILEAGAFALPMMAGLPEIAGAHPQAGLSAKNEEVIRKWYAAWEVKDWRPLDALLAEDFTFSSAAGDDHISKSVFKTRCWESNIDFMKRFDLDLVCGSGNEALVLYTGRTKVGRSFRNVEHLRLRDGKLIEMVCYFGEQSSFPAGLIAKPS
jgi:ketosteroid isomerase-like protein